MTKRRTTYGLERVPFNRRAKELRADDNLAALKVLAVLQVFPMPGKGRPAAELWQSLATAATGAAVAWWTDGGNCYTKVRKAISAAARTARARGKGAAVTWRGAYNKHTRQYVSGENWTHANAVELLAVMGDDFEPGTEAPSEVSDTDAREELDTAQRAGAERAAQRDAAAKVEQAGEVVIAAGAAMLEQGAERVDQDGGHADDVRLNPRDDGETVYGVEGATRGLNTGRLVPDAVWIARQMALTNESDDDQAFYDAIDRSGGFDAWVSKNGDRQRARGAHASRYAGVRGRVVEQAWRILKANSAEALQAAWVTVAPPTDTLIAAPGSPPGAEPWAGVVSAAWPKESPTRRRGRLWRPEVIYQGYWDTVIIGGHAWGDQQRNLKAWRRWAVGPAAFSLLDLACEGVKVQTRVRPHGTGRRIVRRVTVRGGVI